MVGITYFMGKTTGFLVIVELETHKIQNSHITIFQSKNSNFANMSFISFDRNNNFKYVHCFMFKIFTKQMYKIALVA